MAKDEIDIREHRNAFIRRWLPAFRSRQDQFLKDVDNLLRHQRTQCLENAKRCGCSSVDASKT